MSKNSIIALVGGGQLGSRHLQALRAVKRPLEIHVIDPSADSLKMSKERFEAAPDSGAGHQVSYHQTFESAPREIDLVINATTAMHRHESMAALHEGRKIRYAVLEKVLFSKAPHYDSGREILKKSGTTAWVNLPMRQRDVFIKMLDVIKGERIIYSVTIGAIGLITNSIHYVDHMVQLTGQEDFTLDFSGLDRKVHASKRQGYSEFSGTLVVRFPNGSFGNFTFFPEPGNPPLIEITTAKHRYILRDMEKLMWTSSAASEWKWTEEPLVFPQQSKMTTEIVESILASGKCPLTTYDESARTHLRFFEPLKKHFEMLTGKPTDSYPFT